MLPTKAQDIFTLFESLLPLLKVENGHPLTIRNFEEQILEDNLMLLLKEYYFVLFYEDALEAYQERIKLLFPDDGYYVISPQVAMRESIFQKHKQDMDNTVQAYFDAFEQLNIYHMTLERQEKE